MSGVLLAICWRPANFPAVAARLRFFQPCCNLRINKGRARPSKLAHGLLVFEISHIDNEVDQTEKLGGALHFAAADRTKSKISVVALFASIRANQQECANHSLERAPSPRPAYRIGAASRTVVFFPKLYGSHRIAFMRAGRTRYILLRNPGNTPKPVFTCI